jgi:uncharacterized protein YjbI with pentapeptide repeats
VHAELSAYLARRMGKWYKKPFSRIISIDIDQSLSTATQHKRSWEELPNYVYVPESAAAITNGEPGKEVVDRLTKAASFMNSWRRFIMLLLLTVLVIFTAASLGIMNLVGLKSEISASTGRLEQINDSIAKLSKRQYHENVALHDTTFVNKIFTNITYRSGVMTKVNFDTCTFLDLYFVGKQDSMNNPGITLHQVKLFNCNLSTVNFDKTIVSNSTFESCRFRGGIIDISNFSNTLFLSDTAEVIPDTVMTVSQGKVTYFDNCIIQNVHTSANNRTATFVEVVFNDCIFKGNFNDQVFRKCSFDRCVFPNTIQINSMKKNGNEFYAPQLYAADKVQ